MGDVHTGLGCATPEENRPLIRPGQRCEDNIKMDYQKIGCGGMDWNELA
jgi:hypothetical protein